MKELIEENYKSIVKRGLITPETTKQEFRSKLLEEVGEYQLASMVGLQNEREELADIILVCLNIARHHEIDIEQELKNKIEINKNR